MFEVGKGYEFRTLEGGDETSWYGVIEKYEHPLLKTADVQFSPDSDFFPGGIVEGRIINVTSPAFIGATLSKHQEKAGG